MVSVPLPFVTFALCAALSVFVWRIDLGRPKASICFAAFFALFAMGAFFVGLRFGYGIESFIRLQRGFPLLGGPLLYLGFLALSLDDAAFKKAALLHLGMALVGVVAVGLILTEFVYVDLVISISYLCYIALLFLMWRKGPDHLIHARLDLATPLNRWILRGALVLFGSLLIDAVIAFDFVMRSGDNVSRIISIASVPFIAFLLALVFMLPRYVAPKGEVPKPAPESGEDVTELEASARALLTSAQLYLDPELTVERLAKRLHVPVRALSVAVNQSQNMNVSQYVNGFRLEHAAGLLRSSEASVSVIGTQSGFLTRSNFYREFQRVYGQTPASYRKENG